MFALGRRRSHGCRLHRPGQGPLRRPFIRGQPLVRQSHLFPKNSGTCPTLCRHLLSLSRSWECQAPLSSLHLCSDLSSGCMLISESAAHTHMYTYTYVLTRHSQTQPLFPYGIFHLLAELINFISCLLGGNSRAGASFPVNHKQQ